MGFSLAWVAVRGTSRDKLLSTLGARATGECEEVPESSLVGAALPSGWYLVVADHFGPLEDGELARKLSKAAESICCWVEEHAMFSMACGFTGGKERWRVAHESAQAIDHLEVSGQPPPFLEEIRRALLERQRSDQSGRVDYVFDVPIELAKRITGYRHDEDIPGAGDAPFEILEEI